MKILLHQRADRTRQAGVDGNREVEGAHLALFQHFTEGGQRNSVAVILIEFGIEEFLGRAKVYLTEGLSSNSERNTEMPSTMEVRSLGSIRRQS